MTIDGDATAGELARLQRLAYGPEGSLTQAEADRLAVLEAAKRPQPRVQAATSARVPEDGRTAAEDGEGDPRDVATPEHRSLGRESAAEEPPNVEFRPQVDEKPPTDAAPEAASVGSGPRALLAAARRALRELAPWRWWALGIAVLIVAVIAAQALLAPRPDKVIVGTRVQSDDIDPLIASLLDSGDTPDGELDVYRYPALGAVTPWVIRGDGMECIALISTDYYETSSDSEGSDSYLAGVACGTDRLETQMDVPMWLIAPDSEGTLWGTYVNIARLKPSGADRIEVWYSESPATDPTEQPTP